jgi:hypothetical protein
VDDVDEVLAAMSFAQPVRKWDFRAEARVSESLERRVEISNPDEDIEILGMALDARVPRKGVGTADEHLESRRLEHGKRVAVELALFGSEDMRRRGGRHRHF